MFDIHKKQGVCLLSFLFFFFFFLGMLYLFGQHCVNFDPAPPKKAVPLCPVLEPG